jgi:hypothetical protein
LKRSYSCFAHCRKLDQTDLVDHGVLRQDDVRTWRAYCADPVRWFLCANPQAQKELWQAAVERMELINSAAEKAKKQNVVVLKPHRRQ